MVTKRSLVLLALVAALTACQGGEGQEPGTQPDSDTLPTVVPGVQSTDVVPDTQQMTITMPLTDTDTGTPGVDATASP